MHLKNDIYGLLPNLAEWMKDMSNKGHEVILLGEGLLQLAKGEPTDNTKTIRLWLAVVADVDCPAGQGGSYNRRMIVGQDVRVFNKEGALHEALIGGELDDHVPGRLVPLSDAGKSEMWPQWHQTESGPNIQVVWIRGVPCPSKGRGPDVHLCPVASSGNCQEVVDGFSVGCRPLTPGWTKKNPEDTYPSIPYAFVMQGEEGRSQKAEIFWSKPTELDSQADRTSLVLNVACGRGPDRNVAIIRPAV